MREGYLNIEGSPSDEDAPAVDECDYIESDMEVAWEEGYGYETEL